MNELILVYCYLTFVIFTLRTTCKKNWKKRGYRISIYIPRFPNRLDSLIFVTSTSSRDTTYHNRWVYYSNISESYSEFQQRDKKGESLDKSSTIFLIAYKTGMCTASFVSQHRTG